jgi:hypothetical protein
MMNSRCDKTTATAALRVIRLVHSTAMGATLFSPHALDVSYAPVRRLGDG